ncbi:MAG: glutathione S-transferase N-terminal domain-containing protein [Rhodospirillales bacterium]
MKLWFSTASPFVRKVRMAAIELGLDDRVELVEFGRPGPASAVAADNPLGKVPTLVTDDGEAIYDSSVICEYLDGLAGSGRLLPTDFTERTRVKVLEALADGVMDAGVLRIMESRRPENERSPAWVEKQTQACRQGLDGLEAVADRLGDGVSVAHIAICCGLGWLEFRSIEPDWRDSRPALADWYAGFSARPSAQTTEPTD